MSVVAKIGSSSVTTADGSVDENAIAAFCAQVAEARSRGDEVVVVSSGAIAAGLTGLGLGGDERPRDAATLQAVATVGQSRLMATYEHALGAHGLIAGQVLLTPFDFGVREQYLHARRTLGRLLELGVVPIVNENDATADDEIRYGDNDRLAALVAHLIGAEVLVLLTDTAGLFTADPRIDTEATLIEAVHATDNALDAVAGGPGSVHGSGGMASKLAAARIATYSGVRAVIARANRPKVLVDAIDGVAGTGTSFTPRDRTLGARKLWIAFARSPRGSISVDAGARRALVVDGRSLLPAGAIEVSGSFTVGDAVEIRDPNGEAFAKGLARVDASVAQAAAGHRTGDLDGEASGALVHRDDLVVLTDQ